MNHKERVIALVESVITVLEDEEVKDINPWMVRRIMSGVLKMALDHLEEITEST